MDLTEIDYHCCTLDANHTGPCVWQCSDCHGTGECWLCLGASGLDDLTWCSECDGTGICYGCNGTSEQVGD